MTALEKFRESMIGPSVVLFLICLVITFALAFVNQTTAPIIEEGAIRAANLTRAKVMPGSETFSEITGVTLPQGIGEAYKADNGSGYVFRSTAKGYGGDVVFMIGIDKEGKVVGIEMFEHNETPGLGTKVANTNFLQDWMGSADPQTVDGITGATRTTNALRNALTQAKAAFELVKGVG